MTQKREVKYTKEILQKMSVKIIQDLRSAKKLTNIKDMPIGQVDLLILAKLQSINILGPFVVELNYYGDGAVIVKDKIIKKLKNSLPKIIKNHVDSKLPSLDLIIIKIPVLWIKLLLTDVFNNYTEIHQEDVMVVFGDPSNEETH